MTGVWNHPYFIPLYNAMLIPTAIFVVGLLVEWFGNLLTLMLSWLFGKKAAFFIRNRLTFIGTVHHELAHALFATVSGAKVTKIELFKVRGKQLGCVEFYPRGNAVIRAIQMTLASIAPVLCGALSLSVIFWIFTSFPLEIWQIIVLGYLFISIFFHMNMSTQDVKNAWKGIPVILLIEYIVFLVTDINLLADFLAYMRDWRSL